MLVSTLNPNRVVLLLIIKLLRGGSPALPSRQAIHFDDSKRLRRALQDAPRATRSALFHDDVPGGGYGSPRNVLVTADQQVFLIG